MTLEKNRKRNRVRFLTPKKEPMKEPRKELIQEPTPKNRTESENLAPPSYTPPLLDFFETETDFFVDVFPNRHHPKKSQLRN